MPKRVPYSAEIDDIFSRARSEATARGHHQVLSSDVVKELVASSQTFQQTIEISADETDTCDLQPVETGDGADGGTSMETLALIEMRRLGERKLKIEHLMLAVARDSRAGGGAESLRRSGIDPELLRVATIRRLAAERMDPTELTPVANWSPVEDADLFRAPDEARSLTGHRANVPISSLVVRVILVVTCGLLAFTVARRIWRQRRNNLIS